MLSATFSRVTLRSGFMESPNVPKSLAIVRNAAGATDGVVEVGTQSAFRQVSI